jgi:hypothetical protein
MLVAAGLGTFAVDLFIGREPETPDNAITIFDTPGRAPMKTFDQKNFFFPSIQIRVRNNDYITGWDLINDIKLSLHHRAQETWNGTLYSSIYCTIEPALLDFDHNNRPRFVTTFNIERR